MKREDYDEIEKLMKELDMTFEEAGEHLERCRNADEFFKKLTEKAGLPVKGNSRVPLITYSPQDEE